MKKFLNRRDLAVFVALAGVLVVAMLTAGCAGDGFWSDKTADAVQAKAEEELDRTQQVIESPDTTPEEKAVAIERNLVQKAKLELLAELRSEAHSQDGTIEAASQTIDIVGQMVPGYGPGIVAAGGIVTAIWQAFARRRSAKALAQLSKGINVGKQNSPELARALDSTKAIIGYFLDDDSRKLVDQTRKAPENNPAVTFPSVAVAT